jgi:hypothetical protein
MSSTVGTHCREPLRQQHNPSPRGPSSTIAFRDTFNWVLVVASLVIGVVLGVPID